MPKVFVEPIGLTLTVDEQENLLDGLVRAQIDIPTDCAGRGTCGKCLMRLGSGELTAPTEREIKRIPEKLRAEGWRLACQAYPRSARVSIEVRGTAGQRRILTTSKLTHGASRPAVRTVSVQLEPPTLTDKRSDLERFDDGLGGVDVPLHVLECLPAKLRDGKWKVTATCYGKRVIDVHPGEGERELYGVAVDVGTSKVIAYLFDLNRGTLIDQEAVENPQMRYGEDVISRIAHASQHNDTATLAAAVREGINANLAALYERQEVHPNHVCDMTVVGNTAMHHLALGLSPVGLGQAPFAPAAAEPLTLRASELGLNMNPDGGVHFPPPIAGFVGSDALAVVAATHLANKKRPSMAIDIGTNTEIALAHDGRITVTSCASGPAFEGYQIRNGMKAVAGAIERVKITPEGDPVEIVTIAGAEPIGICGSGVVDLLAGLVHAGVIDKGGRMQKDHPRVSKGEEGSEYLLTTGPHGNIVFTQHDVRSLQLAKGAIHSGWELLMDGLGVSLDELATVYIAGAFGNYLDLAAAQYLGLFPPVATRRVAFVGNAAGVGAQMALIDVRARRRMARLRDRIEFLDLATDKRFLDVFAGRLGFAGD
ncbi:MAG TPA: ASKHA domain-containing protein [Thermoleophilia bacterium]|nr:ASKHA domain-containing protein [Thermoleophilia bacterium]